jgi:hypothetical protein
MNWLRIFKIGLATGILVVGLGFWDAVGWWWPISSECGQLAARFDVHFGRYRVLRYGLAGHDRRVMRNCLRIVTA